MVAFIVVALIALALGAPLIVTVRRNAARLRAAGEVIGDVLGGRVSGTTWIRRIEARSDGTQVTGTLRYDRGAMSLELEIDARGAADAPDPVDLDRVRATLALGANGGGGVHHASLRYPVDRDQLRMRVDDLVYLARVSAVLDANALFVLDPRTPGAVRDVVA